MLFIHKINKKRIFTKLLKEPTNSDLTIVKQLHKEKQKIMISGFIEDYEYLYYMNEQEVGDCDIQMSCYFGRYDVVLFLMKYFNVELTYMTYLCAQVRNDPQIIHLHNLHGFGN
jgi:hypothetical protein